MYAFGNILRSEVAVGPCVLTLGKGVALTTCAVRGSTLLLVDVWLEAPTRSCWR